MAIRKDWLVPMAILLAGATVPVSAKPMPHKPMKHITMKHSMTMHGKKMHGWTKKGGKPGAAVFGGAGMHQKTPGAPL